jgi:hypothetical protein
LPFFEVIIPKGFLIKSGKAPGEKVNKIPLQGGGEGCDDGED